MLSAFLRILFGQISNPIFREKSSMSTREEKESLALKIAFPHLFKKAIFLSNVLKNNGGKK